MFHAWLDCGTSVASSTWELEADDNARVSDHFEVAAAEMPVTARVTGSKMTSFPIVNQKRPFQVN